MEDIGYGGTAVNRRTYPNEHLVTDLEKARSLARFDGRSQAGAVRRRAHHRRGDQERRVPEQLEWFAAQVMLAFTRR
jgi:hypothetical protein